MKTAIFILAILASSVSLAHPGRTDRDGCHVNRKTGERHCHKPRNVNTSNMTDGEREVFMLESWANDLINGRASFPTPADEECAIPPSVTTPTQLIEWLVTPGCDVHTHPSE